MARNVLQRHMWMDGWTDVDILYCGGQIPMLQMNMLQESSGRSFKIIAQTVFKSQKFFLSCNLL